MQASRPGLLSRFQSRPHHGIARRPREQPFQQSAQVKTSAADYYGDPIPYCNFLQHSTGRLGIFTGGEDSRWVNKVEKMVRNERPKAQIELVTTLGAVVGTHAGPGTVGFFWFDDDR